MDNIIKIDNIFYILMYYWDNIKVNNLKKLDGVQKQLVLEDYIIKLLLKEIKYIVKKGIHKNYRSNSEEIKGIKGKIYFNESLKKQSFFYGRTHCNFDEYTEDTPINIVIKNTLSKILKIKNLDSTLKRETKQFLIHFQNISNKKLTLKDFSDIKLVQSTLSYKLAINICKLIYENILPNETDGDYYFYNFLRDENKMNLIFEGFLRNFYKTHKKDINAKHVRRNNIKWNSIHNIDIFLPRMETDITIEFDDRIIIVDAKFYKETLNKNGKIRSEHLYQLTSYLDNYMHNLLNLEGVLIYPEINQKLDLEYFYNNKKLKIKTINLNKDWQDIHVNLLKIIKK